MTEEVVISSWERGIVFDLFDGQSGARQSYMLCMRDIIYPLKSMQCLSYQTGLQMSLTFLFF
jgi:hypothetical protein